MLDINLVKEYLKISDSDEDLVINQIKAGVEIFAKHFAKNELEKPEISDDLKACMLDHIAFLYENRGTADCEIPSRILHVYKKYKNFRI